MAPYACTSTANCRSPRAPRRTDSSKTGMFAARSCCASPPTRRRQARSVDTRLEQRRAEFTPQIEDAATVAGADEEPGVAEHSEVLVHGRSGDAEPHSELGRRGRVAECGEQARPG